MRNEEAGGGRREAGVGGRREAGGGRSATGKGATGKGATPKAATGKSVAGTRLRVKQVRSTSGRPALHRRTLVALGLRYHQQVIEIGDSPAIRGMLFQVRHLVEVSPAGVK